MADLSGATDYSVCSRQQKKRTEKWAGFDINMGDTIIPIPVSVFRYDYAASSKIIETAKTNYGESLDSTRGSSLFDDDKKLT